MMQGPPTGEASTASTARAISHSGAWALSERSDFFAATPDGSLWATARDQVMRVSPSGRRQSIPINVQGVPRSVASSADGTVWMMSLGAILRISPAGDLSSFDDSRFDDPGTITAGPDGNMWFTYIDGLGYIKASGGLTFLREQVLPDGDGPGEAVFGKDGTLYVTRGLPRIGRFNPENGTSDQIDVPWQRHPDLEPQFPTIDSRGNLWFTDERSRVYVLAKGSVKEVFAMTRSTGELAADSDGRVWFLDGSLPGKVRGVSADGGIVTLDVPIDVKHVLAGPPGMLWLVYQGFPTAVQLVSTQAAHS
jgi:streptogramin lyase